MINSYKFKLLLSTVICASVIGCTMPNQGIKTNKIVDKQIEAAIDIVQESSLSTTSDSDSLYNSTAEVVVLGKPYQIRETQTLPPAFFVDAGFRKFENQPLENIIEFLNRQFSNYGIAIGFSTDAIDYLSGNTSSSFSSASGGDDSSGDYDISQDYSGQTSTSGLLSSAGVSMSLDLKQITNLSQILDGIAARTNLWWEFSNGRVNFYRLKSRNFDVDQYATTNRLTSKLSSSSSGGAGGDGTVSDSSSSHSYDTEQDFGDAMKQLEAAVTQNLTPQGKVTFIPALGIANVLDTPTALDRIEKIIDNSNHIAGRQIKLELEIWELITTDETNYGIENSIKYSNENLNIGFDGVSFGDNSTLGKIGATVTSGRFKGTETALRALQGTRSLSLMKRTQGTTFHNGTLPIQFVNEKGYAKNIPTVSNGDNITKGIETATTTNGIVLFASPKINSDGTIDVKVVADISSLNSLDPFTDGENTVLLPDRTVSALITSRRIKNGQTEIMTGFEQTLTNSSNSSLFGGFSWLLGGGDKSSATRSIMLVVVTPFIEDIS